MPDAGAADSVAAYLDQVRRDIDPEPDGIRIEQAVRVAARDVPRLLAALDAVLDLHKPEGRAWKIQPCRAHRLWGTYTISTPPACRDCRFTETVTCWQGKCRDEGWPCTEYRAISAELLGERKPGGGDDG